jgi:hypothetical protein
VEECLEPFLALGTISRPQSGLGQAGAARGPAGSQSRAAMVQGGLDGALGGDRVVLDLRDELRDREAQLAEPEAESPTGDPEEPSRPELVAPRRLEHQREEFRVDLTVAMLVEILAAVLQLPAKERSIVDLPGPPTSAIASARGPAACAKTGAGDGTLRRFGAPASCAAAVGTRPPSD